MSALQACALESHLTPALRAIQPDQAQGAIPALAKDPESTAQILDLLADVPTSHEVILGDAREVRLPPSSVHLAVTSPPYWTLKDYPDTAGQMGRMADYHAFLAELGKVWESCFDALVPGGRLVCVVGDVCLSRRRNGGRHAVVPLHAAIQTQCIALGFDNLAPIIWHKIANVQTEAGGSGSYLGKPFEPNGIIKNDIEFILMLRKPGGYRSPSRAARVLSLIAAEDHDRWFRQIWQDVGGASTRDHPAPFPLELAARLIRMFSFAGDTVYDPFTGTATTQAAARQFGRNSIGVEIEPAYHAMAEARLTDDLFARRG
ncbi:MAG: site-specific DNA-methyltransferase [Defluviicoccus sp.]|nr:site-specific DNA-methyltransferase [Defluviicoccus sp.]MDE0277792.1 site-specific DNA-methyltransferase [Defluviicoccus sp.]